MARVLAFVPDLMFASRVQSALADAGHEVELIAAEPRLAERLQQADAPRAQALVVDLTDAVQQRASMLSSLAAAGALEGVRSVAFYSHVDVAAREAAQRAGVTLAVPRSRMAREGARVLELALA